MTEPLFCPACHLWADVPPGGDCPECGGRLALKGLIAASVMDEDPKHIVQRRRRRRFLSGRFSPPELN